MSEKKALATQGETKPKRKRPDRTDALSVHVESGDNALYLQQTMKMWRWPKVDMREPEQVEARVLQYFQMCIDDDTKPSVAGLAYAFGVDRKTLWAWVNGIDSAYIPAESRNLIKKAYSTLTVQMENYMQNGKINPVAGIFLMKNNMDYKDKQEVVLTPNSQMGDSATPEELQQRYIEATVGDYEEE